VRVAPTGFVVVGQTPHTNQPVNERQRSATTLSQAWSAAVSYRRRRRQRSGSVQLSLIYVKAIGPMDGRRAK